MKNTNLLDLNNDILNIIGDYIKEDNKKNHFTGMDDEIDFLRRTNNFDQKQINKLISNVVHDGVLKLEECTEYAYIVKERNLKNKQTQNYFILISKDNNII